MANEVDVVAETCHEAFGRSTLSTCQSENFERQVRAKLVGTLGSGLRHCGMEAIYRDDGELCGFVRAHLDEWQALAVFGGRLGTADSQRAAERMVLETGLPALAERWLLVSSTQPEEQIVCIQEASPEGLTVALDFYSMPGVPTLRITRAEIDNGDCRLRRDH